jgi:hypothetical protein
MNDQLTPEMWIGFHLSPFQQAILCIGLPLLFSMTLLLIIRRVIHPRMLRQHHGIAGPFLNTIGTFFGILLAFVVAESWYNYYLTESNASQEARIVEFLHQDTIFIKDASKKAGLPELIKNYRDSVVTTEWPLLAKGEGSPEVDVLLKRLTDAYAHIQPKSGSETAYYGLLVKNLQDLKVLRATRIYDSRSTQIPFLWAILITGALITITFSCLFGAQNFSTHVIMVFLLTSVICLAFYTILTLDFPFSGLVRVGPNALSHLNL